MASNPALALRLQANALVGRVAELGSLGGMNARVEKIGVWLVISSAAIVLIWFVVLPHILYSGPVGRNTPMMREISRMHQICTKLRYFADEHHSFPAGDATGKTVDSLVVSGILSTDDAAYIREHYFEFRGFDPTRIGGDIPVLETTFTNTQTPRRIVGYSDGSVVTYDLHKTRWRLTARQKSGCFWKVGGLGTWVEQDKAWI